MNFKKTKQKPADTMPPFYSIIVPTHQRALLLRRTLASIKAQSPAIKTEVIVIADIADAKTDEICQELLDENDIYVRRNGPCGPSASRNLGMRLATGRYILFLDDDDAWHAGFLEALHARPEIQEGRLVFFDTTHAEERRLETGPELLEQVDMSLASKFSNHVYVKNQIPICNHAFPRNLLDDLVFDIHMRAYEDWDFCLAVYARQWPLHVPVLGTIVYVVKDETTDRRSNAPQARGLDAFLDYMYVYRRHPAPTNEIAVQRTKFIEGIEGLAIPKECL